MAKTPNKKKPGRETAKKDPSDRISRGLLGVAAVTERIARPILGKRGFAEGQVISRWAEIVGSDLAAVSAPDKVQFERGRKSDGVLHLRVATGGAATLIQPQAPVIIDRVNGFLGPGTIRHIKVRQGPLPTRRNNDTRPATEPLSEEQVAEAEHDIGALESEPVRAALARLGARLKARSTR